MEHNHESDSITDSSRGEKAATLQGTHVTEEPHQNPVPHDYLSAVENGLIEDLPPPTNFAQRWAFKLERLAGVEARGIERVPEAIRAQHATLGDYAQMGVIWFSANVTMNNVIIGFLGPLLFEVGLKDAMILSAFGAYLGAAGPGYVSCLSSKRMCSMKHSAYTLCPRLHHGNLLTIHRSRASGR
jgi:hypothetical protein